MKVERTSDEVIIRLPSSINIIDLQEMANYIRYKELSQKSYATEEQVQTLVREAKVGRWAKARKRLL